MVVALASSLAIEGADGARGEALIANMARRDDSDDGELVARELTFEDFILGPGIEAVEDDAFLAGFDEVVDLGDDLADDPVVTFFFADLFAEDLFVLGGNFDAAFGHFFEVHAAEIGFWDAAVGEVVDEDGFAGAGHADDGEKFDVFGSVVHGVYYNIGGQFRGDLGFVWYNEGNETFGDY